MAAITRASVITASTRSCAPQREQRLTSMSNTRRRRCAQLIWARVRTGSGSAAPSLTGGRAGPGTTRRRWRALLTLASGLNGGECRRHLNFMIVNNCLNEQLGRLLRALIHSPLHREGVKSPGFDNVFTITFSGRVVHAERHPVVTGIGAAGQDAVVDTDAVNRGKVERERRTHDVVTCLTQWI